jgi:hypothetical protein
MSDKQNSLFDNPPAWTEHWEGMPEFKQENLMPVESIKVHFRDKAARMAFLQLLGESPNRRSSIWYPSQQIRRSGELEYKAVKQGRYPVFVISKGRAKTRYTSKALEQLGIEYSIVIEPHEYHEYAAVIDAKRILTLPFSNLGQGSIPARNWVWDYAISIGASRHWILDDNIDGFASLNNNIKAKVTDCNPFVEAEDLTDKYQNVALSGLNYRFFAKAKQVIPPLYVNTRVYSCILINHDIPYRWRGRYNEDTDLSIRALKDGWCTILFNTMLINKAATMTVKGGNTDELYKDDGRLKMAQSLQEQHPDIVKITEKWGRYQHHVDYSVFKKNKLKLREAGK